MGERLKRCPWCLSEHVGTSSTWRRGYATRRWAVVCWMCKQSSPERATEEEAVEVWSRGPLEARRD